VYFAEAHIEIDPYKLEVHQLAGRAYEQLKDWARAAREFEVATAIDEKDVESWVGLARARKALGDAAGARKAVDQALDIDGTHAEAKALRGSL